MKFVCNIEEISLIVAHYLFFFFNLAVEKYIRYTRIYTIFEESSLKLCTVKVSDQNWYISAWLLYHVLLRRKSMFNAA